MLEQIAPPWLTWVSAQAFLVKAALIKLIKNLDEFDVLIIESACDFTLSTSLAYVKVTFVYKISPRVANKLTSLDLWHRSLQQVSQDAIIPQENLQVKFLEQASLS